MEQLPENENKKGEQKNGEFHLDLSGLSPEERRETFMKLFGLPENATEADMTALINEKRGESKKKDEKASPKKTFKDESEEEVLQDFVAEKLPEVSPVD
jgi:hypothetical protein